MKRSRFTLQLSAAFISILTAVSCNKDGAYAPGSCAAGKVDVCITGVFNDFGTKAAIENIFRMTWSEGSGDPKVYDKVFVYGKASGGSVFSCLGTLDAEPDATTGNRVADLKGTITQPQTGTKITLVYSPLLTLAPNVENGTISIDLSSQSGKADSVLFVAYAAVDYEDNVSATYRTSFNFATSVLRANVSGLSASTELTKATLGKIETKCKLAFATDAAPTVSGDNSTGTITRTFTGCSANAKGTSAFYIAVPAITANEQRTLTVIQQGDIDYDAIGFATGSKDAGNLMNSIFPMITTGQHGILNGQEYVLIKAKYDGTNDSYLKWSTQNLAVTASGNAKWNSTDYVIGDYFQWAASYAGYNITAEAFKKPANLVIYDSFKTKCTGGSDDSFFFKTGRALGFDITNAPYYNGSSFTKYTVGSATLAPSDDVANIVLGGTWRMPTGGSAGQFSKMRAVTYWAWDATDKGYYVFKPGVGTSGTAGARGVIGSSDEKTKALLFFPAAGCGSGTILASAGVGGLYWSSTLCTVFNGYNLSFVSSGVTPEQNTYRLIGLSVRPVSD